MECKICVNVGILGLQKTITLIIHDYSLKFFPVIFKLKPLHQSEAYAPTHIITLLQFLTFFFFLIFVINFNKNLINEIKIIISDIVKLNPKKTKEKTLSKTQYGNSTLAYISHNLATSSSISFNRFFMSST